MAENGRPSTSYHQRENGGGRGEGEDTPDVLVPPLARSSMPVSPSSVPNGNGGVRPLQLNGNESADARRWYLPSFWKPSAQQGYKVEEIPAGPVASCDSAEDSYNMDHPMRGKCIIFNHTIFEKSQGLSDRPGSDVDVSSIQSTFSKFGFTLTTYQNFRYDEIMRSLKMISNEDHSPNDCLVVFILTHGQANQLHAYDVTYKPSSLWDHFTADKCTSLAGKPKMFFIQACRGEKYDDGTELIKPRFSRTQVDGPSNGEEGYRIPNQADFLTVYSTYEAAKENVDFLRYTMQYLSLGYYSWRNSRNGSCFIKWLCKVFQEKVDSKDVLAMLTLVNRQVGIAYESRSNEPAQNRKKQIPHVCHTLMREIWLRPKIHSTLV